MFKVEYSSFTLQHKEELSYDPLENSQMVSDVSSNPDGDWVALAAGVRNVADVFARPVIVEVGTAHGASTRNIYNFMEVYAPEKEVKYIAIDSKLHGYDPYYINDVAEIQFIDGLSTDPDVIAQIPDEVHFLFIDACHCKEHVYQDLVNYTPKVVQGGYVALHDCLPEFQGGSEQPSTPQCDPDDTHIGVLKGIERFGMEGYELVFEDFPKDKEYGGARIYRKK